MSTLESRHPRPSARWRSTSRRRRRSGTRPPPSSFPSSRGIDLHSGGTMRPRHALMLIVALISATSLADQAKKKTWDFAMDEPGKIAKGFTNEVGRWEVAKDGDNQVLAQKAKSEDAV